MRQNGVRLDRAHRGGRRRRRICRRCIQCRGECRGVRLGCMACILDSRGRGKRCIGLCVGRGHIMRAASSSTYSSTSSWNSAWTRSASLMSLSSTCMRHHLLKCCRSSMLNTAYVELAVLRASYCSTLRIMSVVNAFVIVSSCLFFFFLGCVRSVGFVFFAPVVASAFLAARMVASDILGLGWGWVGWVGF